MELEVISSEEKMSTEEVEAENVLPHCAEKTDEIIDTTDKNKGKTKKIIKEVAIVLKEFLLA